MSPGPRAAGGHPETEPGAAGQGPRGRRSFPGRPRPPLAFLLFCAAQSREGAPGRPAALPGTTLCAARGSGSGLGLPRPRFLGGRCQPSPLRPAGAELSHYPGARPAPAEAPMGRAEGIRRPLPSCLWPAMTLGSRPAFGGLRSRPKDSCTRAPEPFSEPQSPHLCNGLLELIPSGPFYTLG